MAAARRSASPRARRETARHVDARARAGAGEPLAVRARPVQHALRVRRRRGADLDQRRSGRRRAAGAHRPRGRRGHARRSARRGRATSLGVRGPFGTAWPVEAADGRDVVVVAGGIGLAPLRPALYHAARRPRALRPRGRCSTARARPDDICSSATSSSAGGARSTSRSRSPSTRAGADWRGHVGVVTDADRARRASTRRTRSRMVCGPEVMMRFAVAALRDARRRRRARSTSRWSAT